MKLASKTIYAVSEHFYLGTDTFEGGLVVPWCRDKSAYPEFSESYYWNKEAMEWRIRKNETIS